jgi:uncharacterized heparinase superfamily protein
LPSFTPQHIGLYFLTLRYLKPEQIFWRVWYKVYRPRPDLRPAPGVRETSVIWAAPARRAASMTGPDRFRFLNHEAKIDRPGAWDDPALDKLWRFNLHYFDDLNAVDADQRNEWHHRLIHRWLMANPPAKGTGWEPYPTALRIVNWIKWALAGNHPSPRMRHSLAVQTRWLAKHLEWHLLGNHLFADAKALVFAGLFFEGPEAAAWLSRGLSILAREIPEQILPDGGQFERSPMYHALALEDVLDLINVARAYEAALPDEHRPLVSGWPVLAARMQRCLAALCHPDGEIAFFNDAALGIAPRPAELTAYAARLGLAAVTAFENGLTHLEDSGYVRVASGDAVALLDAAPVGPDCLPGHAHADTLSFELSLHGRRVLVNSGTSVYGRGEERQRQRGTPAHNTVAIDGKNSSQVWSGFRVAHRARPFDRKAYQEDDTIAVSCAHNGYRRLPDHPVHRRDWHFAPGQMKVTDTIEGAFSQAQARFHVHPECRLQAVGRAFRIDLPDGRRVDVTLEGGRAEVAPATWHPEFGQSLPNQCLAVDFTGNRLETVFAWKHKVVFGDLSLEG